jgi:hypothetical protein
LVVAPYGVLAYLIFQGRGMEERNLQQAQSAREALRRELVSVLPMKIKISIG